MHAHIHRSTCLRHTRTHTRSNVLSFQDFVPPFSSLKILSIITSSLFLFLLLVINHLLRDFVKKKKSYSHIEYRKNDL